MGSKLVFLKSSGRLSILTRPVNTIHNSVSSSFAEHGRSPNLRYDTWRHLRRSAILRGTDERQTGPEVRRPRPVSLVEPVTLEGEPHCELQLTRRPVGGTILAAG